MATKVETLYKIPEVCQILRITRQTLFFIIKAGDLETMIVGARSVRISEQAITDYIELCKTRKSKSVVRIPAA